MTQLIVLVLLGVAFLSVLRAVTAGSTERLLWGSMVSSFGLGLAVEVHGGGYYGLLMVAVFVVADLMLYLFFRSLTLLPARAARNTRGDQLYRVFFLWLSLLVLAGMLVLAFVPTDVEVWSAPAVSGFGLLNDRLWAGDWLLVVLPVLGLVVLVTGGFFLVRRQQ